MKKFNKSLDDKVKQHIAKPAPAVRDAGMLSKLAYNALECEIDDVEYSDTLPEPRQLLVHCSKPLVRINRFNG